MRIEKLGKLMLWDIRFQMKYGFYLLYGILTVLYCMILAAMPNEIREVAVSILIFSDPAAMGLFFMGAVILLEKSQRVPWAIAVSPIGTGEYIGGKVGSFCFISLIVAGVLAVVTQIEHLIPLLCGTALASVLFTLAGIIVAAKSASLNQFLLLTIPVEILGLTPAILSLFKIIPEPVKEIMNILPMNVCMDLIAGRGITAPGIVSAAAFIGVLFWYGNRSIHKMWQEMGGVKL